MTFEPLGTLAIGTGRPVVVAVGQFGRVVLESLRQLGTQGIEPILLAPGEALGSIGEPPGAVLVADAEGVAEALSSLWRELRRHVAGKVATVLQASGSAPAIPDCLIVRPAKHTARGVAGILPWILDVSVRLPDVPQILDLWAFDLRPERPRLACARRLALRAAYQIMEAGRVVDPQPLDGFLSRSPAWQILLSREEDCSHPFGELAQAVREGTMAPRQVASEARTAWSANGSEGVEVKLEEELVEGLGQALVAGGFAAAKALLAELVAKIDIEPGDAADAGTGQDPRSPLLSRLDWLARRPWLKRASRQSAILGTLRELTHGWLQSRRHPRFKARALAAVELRWEQLTRLEDEVSHFEDLGEVLLEDYLAALPEGEEAAAAILIARARADRALFSPDLLAYLESHASSRFTWVADRPVGERLAALSRDLPRRAEGTLLLAAPGDLPAGAVLALARQWSPDGPLPEMVPLEDRDQLWVVRMLPDPVAIPGESSHGMMGPATNPATESGAEPIDATIASSLPGGSLPPLLPTARASAEGEEWQALRAELDGLAAGREERCSPAEDLPSWREASVPELRDPAFEAAELLIFGVGTGAIGHTKGQLSYFWREESGWIAQTPLGSPDDPAAAISALGALPAVASRLWGDVQSRLGDSVFRDRLERHCRDILEAVGGRNWLGRPVAKEDRLLAVAAERVLVRLGSSALLETAEP
ncbi:MAG: hypothetical protein KGR26_06825 [Cyanobacteria bacterium REEB65]|nr:hypothetical protein [Cyanobacteria bacterium REEB65]